MFWDAGAGFFRFGDGGFALFGERGDWRRSKEMSCFSAWDM